MKMTKKQKALTEKLGDNMDLRSFDDALKLLRELATAKFGHRQGRQGCRVRQG